MVGRFGRAVGRGVLVMGALLAGPVQAGTLALFSDPFFNGARLEIRDGVDNLANLGWWNDRARSLVVESGVWEICRDAYFRNCRQFAAGTRLPDLRGLGLNAAISSARELVPGPNGGWYPPAMAGVPGGAPPGTVIPLTGGAYPQGAPPGTVVPVAPQGYAAPPVASSAPAVDPGGIRWNDGPSAAPSAPAPVPSAPSGGGITWNTPAPGGTRAFHGAPLSPCEQRVYDALGDRTGVWPTPSFSGNGQEGKADWRGQIWHFRCSPQAINIWQ